MADNDENSNRAKPLKYLALNPEHIKVFDFLQASEAVGIIKACATFAFSGDLEPPALKFATTAESVVYEMISTSIKRRKELSAERSTHGKVGGEASASKRKQTEANRSKRKQTKATPTIAMNSKARHSKARHSKAIEKVVGKPTTQKKPPTISQFVQGGELAGVPADFARQLHKDLTEAGWMDKDGLYVGNWRRYLKSAWNAEQKKIRAARVDGIGGFKIAR